MGAVTPLAKIAKWAALLALILIPVAVCVGYFLGARVHYADNPLALDWDQEGPYVFVEGDGDLSIEYIRQDADGSRRVKRTEHSAPVGPGLMATIHYPLDGTSFDFAIRTEFDIPPSG